METFKVGQRVELHPATDAWMRGDRFGTVDRVHTLRVTPDNEPRGPRVWVRMDRSGRCIPVHPSNLSDAS